MTKNSEHYYTKYQYWCSHCHEPTTSWEETPPVRCGSCNRGGGNWDRCAVALEGRSIEEMHRIINGVERIVEILEDGN